MPTYPPPDKNPKCVCPSLMAAFWCPYGHMLECHYPMTCCEAQCSHLERYADSVDAEEPDPFPLPEKPDMDTPAHLPRTPGAG